MIMKSQIRLFFCCLILLAIFGILITSCTDKPISTTETQTQLIKDITTQEAFALIQSNDGNTDFVIIDVRTPEEFTQGHITGALNYNYNSGTFSSDIATLDKTKTYLIYCKGGSRSGSAKTVMQELNFMTVYNMLGGITQWMAEGLPTII